MMRGSVSQSNARKVVSFVELKELLQQAKQTDDFLLVSLHGFYNKTKGEKYILDRVAREWPDLDGWVLPRTPGEIARIELDRAFPELPRLGWTRRNMPYFDIQPPNYCLESFDGDGVYIDIIACYWQIYRKLWLDVKIPKLKGRYPLLPVAEALNQHKMARNAVVGITTSRALQCRKGKKLWAVKPKNRYLTPYLWATLQGVLHEIAGIGKRLGAIYCATDGFIFPSLDTGRAFSLILTDRGVAHRFIHARCSIAGHGSWGVEGYKSTVTFRQGKPGRGMFELLDIPHPVDDQYFLSWWAKLPPKPKEIFYDNPGSTEGL